MPNKWSYPPASVIPEVERAFPGAYTVIWDAIQAASRFPGAELTSWYRTPEANAALTGGARYSQHQLALAFDVYAANLGELAAHLRAAVPRARVSIAPPGQPPHVHVQALAGERVRAAGALFRRLYPGVFR